MTNFRPKMLHKGSVEPFYKQKLIKTTVSELSYIHVIEWGCNHLHRVLPSTVVLAKPSLKLGHGRVITFHEIYWMWLHIQALISGKFSYLKGAPVGPRAPIQYKDVILPV